VKERSKLAGTHRESPLLAAAGVDSRPSGTMQMEMPAVAAARGGPPRICIVGPLPPPEGGMANQTRQLAELLRSEGFTLEVVRTNMPYSPAWIEDTRGARAVARLAAYSKALWSAFGRCDVVHLMANSGWGVAPLLRACALDRVAQGQGGRRQLPAAAKRNVSWPDLPGSCGCR
jgi:hypothetical protein